MHRNSYLYMWVYLNIYKIYYRKFVKFRCAGSSLCCKEVLNVSESILMTSSLASGSSVLVVLFICTSYVPNGHRWCSRWVLCISLLRCRRIFHIAFGFQLISLLLWHDACYCISLGAGIFLSEVLGMVTMLFVVRKQCWLHLSWIVSRELKCCLILYPN